MSTDQYSDDLKKVFAEAAEIAKVVPESMQEAAFHRAVDALLGATEPLFPKKPGSGLPAPARKRLRAPKAPSEKPGSSMSPKKSGRPGPKQLLEKLHESGFFAQARTMGGILKHIDTQLGYRFRASDLSPALIRVLRDGKLKRTKDENGQYEYQQA
jgi:hypothetical protein